MSAVPFFPVQASAQAPHTDAIYFGLVGLSVAILAIVLGLIFGFAMRYRRASPARRGALPGWIEREFEIGWTVAVLILAVLIAWWSGSSQIATFLPPANALEIHVVAKQWMWKTQHPNGAREINALHVPLDEPVRLVMTSQDVIHSFSVPAFRMKQDVLPGRSTETWFQATQAGTFHLFCTQLCGTEHSRMVGDIVVMKPDDYAHWTATQPDSVDLVAEGRALFVSLGCSACHDGPARVTAPRLDGLYGQTVALADGRSVVADDTYLRQAITDATHTRVAGFPPTMPSYGALIGDDEVVRLTAFIRSLSPGDPR